MDFNEFDEAFQALLTSGTEYQTFCKNCSEKTEKNIIDANNLLRNFNRNLNSVKRIINIQLPELNNTALQFECLHDNVDKALESEMGIDDSPDSQDRNVTPDYTSHTEDEELTESDENYEDTSDSHSDPDKFVPKIYNTRNNKKN